MEGVTVPALVMVGVGAHVAVGTSLVLVFINSAVATGANVAWLPWVGILWMAGAAMVGTTFGAWLAHRAPEVELRRVIAACMALVVGGILLTTVPSLL
mgnify:CR=1 FL=1